MTGLARLLADPERVLAGLNVLPPEASALPKAVRALQTGTEEGARLEDTAALQQRLVAALLSEKGGDISRRDLREGCKTLFHPPLAPGRRPDLAARLFHEVETRQRRAAFLALIGAYLDGYAVDDEAVARLGQRLDEASETWPWRAHDPWPGRVKRHHIFQADRAPLELARTVLASEKSPEAILGDAGLDTDGRRLGGLGQAAFEAACKIVEQSSKAKAQRLQDRLISWACPTGRGRDFGYAKAWPTFASALFKPWEAAPPPSQHQSRISELAIDYAGDPRTMPPRWRQVESEHPDAISILKRWLVRASVLQFFEIVDSVALERMWRFRKAFWASYVEAEFVDDAWIVFGSAGASRARAVAERSGEPALRQFGKLDAGGGRAPNHACLLMRIGDLTIAEWSHNGRCYIWKRDTPKAPRLGRTSYGPDELAHPLRLVERGERIGIAHMQAETFSWQRKVALHIADETGRRTQQRAWAP